MYKEMHGKKEQHTDRKFKLKKKTWTERNTERMTKQKFNKEKLRTEKQNKKWTIQKRKGKDMGEEVERGKGENHSEKPISHPWYFIKKDNGLPPMVRLAPKSRVKFWGPHSSFLLRPQSMFRLCLDKGRYRSLSLVFMGFVEEGERKKTTYTLTYWLLTSNWLIQLKLIVVSSLEDNDDNKTYIKCKCQKGKISK